jgi:peptidoglycan/LPS O-acetylase OafA/YrhL
VRLNPEPQGAFGTLRLLLACVVVWFHAGYYWCGVSEGVSAVVVFLIVSGYAMTGLWHRVFAASDRPVWRFYVDRALRLGPQYYLWLGFAIVIGFVLKLRSVAELSTVKAAVVAAAHLLVVPLDFHPWIPQLQHWIFNPPAWTLGLEVSFYLVFPLLMIKPWLIWPVVLGSLLVTLGGVLEFYNSYVFGFQLLCGSLVYFALGYAIYMRDIKLGTVIAGGLALCSYAAWSQGYFNPNVPVGWVVGAVLVLGLSYLRPRRWDSALGNASYGAYLAHWSLLSLARSPYLVSRWGWFTLAMSAVAMAVSLGFVGYWVAERPVALWRRRLRLHA